MLRLLASIGSLRAAHVDLIRCKSALCVTADISRATFPSGRGVDSFAFWHASYTRKSQATLRLRVMALQGEYVPSTRQWVRDQVDAYERSAGQEANTLRDTGLPIVVVTMRGNKTGNVRKIALMRVEHEGEYALVGSMGGAPKHPVWYYNLLANPDQVTIQDGAEPFEVSVRLLSGPERQTWWTRAVQAYPPYADYQKKTSREIPIFLASRKA
jgi:deazaflavin-dependent oxidoreductase (nitroreductase family)